MRDYKVLLYDRDQTLVTALAHYVNRNPEIPIGIHGFTEWETALQCAGEEVVDLMLLDAAKRGQISTGNAKVLWIADGEGEPQSIARYSPAKIYMDRMLGLLTGSGGLSAEPVNGEITGNLQFLACYSPCGGSGVTTLARQLVESRQHAGGSLGGALYLGMEEYAGEVDPEHRMEEFLYYICKRSANFQDVCGNLVIREGGTDVIPSAGCYTDLRELGYEDLLWMREQLELCGYTFVVADVGAGSLADLRLLEAFDRIYLPEGSNEIMQQKYRQFFLELARRGIYKNLQERIVMVKPEEIHRGHRDGRQIAHN